MATVSTVMQSSDAQYQKLNAALSRWQPALPEQACCDLYISLKRALHRAAVAGKCCGSVLLLSNAETVRSTTMRMSSSNTCPASAWCEKASLTQQSQATCTRSTEMMTRSGMLWMAPLHASSTMSALASFVQPEILSGSAPCTGAKMPTARPGLPVR